MHDNPTWFRPRLVKTEHLSSYPAFDVSGVVERRQRRAGYQPPNPIVTGVVALCARCLIRPTKATWDFAWHPLLGFGAESESSGISEWSPAAITIFLNAI
jgi:hypothetical protein